MLLCIKAFLFYRLNGFSIEYDMRTHSQFGRFIAIYGRSLPKCQGISLLTELEVFQKTHSQQDVIVVYIGVD